jgi:hypothetical protein
LPVLGMGMGMGMGIGMGRMNGMSSGLRKVGERRGELGMRKMNPPSSLSHTHSHSQSPASVPSPVCGCGCSRRGRSVHFPQSSFSVPAVGPVRASGSTYAQTSESRDLSYVCDGCNRGIAKDAVRYHCSLCDVCICVFECLC